MPVDRFVDKVASPPDLVLLLRQFFRWLMESSDRFRMTGSTKFSMEVYSTMKVAGMSALNCDQSWQIQSRK